MRYSDETTTGRVLRGKRPKATIAARAESSDEFSWFRSWLGDFCSGMKGEVKSDTVLAIIGRNTPARARLMQGVGSCSIFVVDFDANTRRLVAPLRKFLPRNLPHDYDLLDAIRNPRTLRDVALRLLSLAREVQIGHSAMGSIESLMAWDEGIAAVFKDAGFGVSRPPTPKQFDRRPLLLLSEQEFAALVVRLGSALGDALSLEAQTRVITQDLDRVYRPIGHLAHRVLHEAIAEDHVFDRAGSRRVTAELARAHGRVVSFLGERADGVLRNAIRPGMLQEEDSRKVLGIRVADVAAGCAADIFERCGLPAEAAARRLRQEFDRVFLNHRWI